MLMTSPSMPCGSDSYHSVVLVLNSLLPCVVLALTFWTIAANTFSFWTCSIVHFMGVIACLASASSLCSLLALNEI